MRLRREEGVMTTMLKGLPDVSLGCERTSGAGSDS